MQKDRDGWHRCEVDNVGAGALYSFVLPDGTEVPDPASRFQPSGVHGPSEVIDLDAFQWRAADWLGRPWHEMVLYEMHIGGFTQEGTFRAAIERLDELQSLGITGIEIMPLADFAGDYNWGYDGVLPYAPTRCYGRPEDLMALVDAAHLRGMNVFLDVVYNHFGPDGNYLPLYAPLFTDKHRTPWGDGINYDGENSRWVREFVIQNALYWIRTFRFDGLRLDAVHAIQDDSSEHLIHELSRRVRAEVPARQVHVIVENEENDSDLLQGSDPVATAQWNDDLHHVLHVAATGADFGYYRDYTDQHSEKLARALAEGFVFQGETMSYSDKRRGKPSAHLSPTSFVSFIQNHDQIGNRALGDRMVTYRSEEELRAIAAIYLLAPQIPMLFMGEEWGAPEPFPFFCNFPGELGEAVRQGRRKEMSRLPGFDAEDLPDPIAQSTFESAKLDWNRRSANVATLEFYRTLVRARNDHVMPLLPSIRSGSGMAYSRDEALEVEWKADGASLLLRANLGSDPVSHRGQSDGAEEIFCTGSHQGAELGPWSVVWSVSRTPVFAV